MAPTETRSDDLLLAGLDATNPLGFLTLLGTVCLTTKFAPGVSVRWTATGSGWRPIIADHGQDRAALVEALADTLGSLGGEPFGIDQRLPFGRDRFREVLSRATADATPHERRVVDVLAGFGSDAFATSEGAFRDTALRLTRSADSAGQGLPYYVLDAQSGLAPAEVDAVLFSPWRYADSCFSLRWDPVEDQRYALRATDPSQASNKLVGTRGVKAANALAAEAFALLPVHPQRNDVATTGFMSTRGGSTVFTWPIWTTTCRIDLIRSLLAHPELSQLKPNHTQLAGLGVRQVFRSERFASSKYYKNFAPSTPV